LLVSFQFQNVLADSIKAKQGQLLGIPIYLRGTSLNVAGYMDLSGIAPTSTTNTSILINATSTKTFLVGKWISPSFVLANSIELPSNYNFLFSMFGNKSTLTFSDANLFCELGYYRNGSETPFFNSTRSASLVKGVFQIMVWQSKLSSNYTFQNADRLYFKVFLWASGSGNFYFAYNGLKVASYFQDPTETWFNHPDGYISPPWGGLYILNTSMYTSGFDYIEVDAGSTATVQFNFHVVIYNSSGTVVNNVTDKVFFSNRTTNGAGIQSANWSCPQISIALTDRIAIQWFLNFSDNPTIFFTFPTWISDQLNATQVDSADWTLYTYTRRRTTLRPLASYGSIYYGTSTYNSNVTNILYSNATAKSWQTAIMFVSYLSARSWQTSLSFLSYLSARQWTTPLSFNGYLATRQWQQSLTFLNYLSSRAWQNPLWFNSYLDVKGWRLPITFLAYLESGEDSYLLIAVFSLILTLSFIFYLLLHKK
jgi:hypothetical protein